MKFSNFFFTMAFFLSSLLIFSTVSYSVNNNYVPPLLSLWCNSSSPSNQTSSNLNINLIKILLDNLTMEAPQSHFSTLNASFKQELYTGLIQCRPALSPENCNLCAQVARATILNLCRSSNTVSAWFDGCYVRISPISSSHNAHLNILNPSCAGRDNDLDPAQLVPALAALFLKLRAGVNISSYRGFSYQEIGLGLTNHSVRKFYGIVECARSLPPQECDSCIKKASEKLLFYCSGKDGATLVHGLCFVRFDSNEFYHGGVTSSAGGGVTGNFTFFTGGNDEGENGGRVKKLVMEYWISGVACFLLFISILWFLRRRALNTAKVGSSDLGKPAASNDVV